MGFCRAVSCKTSMAFKLSSRMSSTSSFGHYQPHMKRRIMSWSNLTHMGCTRMINNSIKIVIVGGCTFPEAHNW